MPKRVLRPEGLPGGPVTYSHLVEAAGLVFVAGQLGDDPATLPKGTKVEVDPTNFKVKEGRLHLFYKSLFGDAQKDWNQHEREWEPAADINWKKLTGEEARGPAR